MSITCQICGTENPLEGEFCEGCGTELSLSKEFSIEPTDNQPQTETPETLPDAPLSQPPLQPQPQTEDLSFDKPQQGSALNPQTPFEELDSLTSSQQTSNQESVNRFSIQDAIDESASSSPETKVDSYETNDFSSEPLQESLSSQSDSQAGTQSSIDEFASPPPEDAALLPTQTSEPITSVEASGAAVPTSIKTAKLVITKFGIVSEDSIPLQSTPLIVGKFDPSTGPVDIDLTGIRGEEYISKQHAELYFDGRWKVRDLGSTNGVYIRSAGAKNYNPRLQIPTELRDSDEISFGNVRFIFRED